VPAARVRPHVAILGCGAVGEALAMGLAEGWRATGVRGRLALWSRKPGRAARLARRLARGPRARGIGLELLEAPEEALAPGRVALLCVSDAAVVSLAEQLGRAAPPRARAAMALHTNGTLGLEALAALRRRGVAVGRLHPYAAVAARAPRLACGTVYGIAGSPRARRAALRLAEWLGGHALLLPARDSGAYHAAASLLGGGLVALLALSGRVLAHTVPSASSRRRALVGLAGSALANVAALGEQRALTGPLARGSVALVRAHLQVLRAEPRAHEAYRVLGATMLELARARGSIDRGTERRLQRLLRDG
jgi:predicted short-subunit dehydrogenase-like oxidoreductase (DUF2520 family)